MTEFQRDKEAAHDYRYFPDPDLVPLEVSDDWLTEVRSILPELPIERRRRFVEWMGLSEKDSETIMGHRATADLFEEVLKMDAPASITAKQFVNVWLKLANDRGVKLPDLGVDVRRMAELARMANEGAVNKTAANQLAEVMLDRREAPSVLAEELGLIQVQDTAATEAWIEEVFAANESAVRDAVHHPKKAKAAAGFLRGQVMKVSCGQADPKLVGKMIEERLADLTGT